MKFKGNSPFYVACFFKAFAQMTLVTGLPFLAIRLGAGPIQLGMLGSATMGVYTVTCLSLSKWVDRLRPKMLVMTALALACLVALAVSTARSVGVLILLAGLDGFLSALYWPLVMAWLGRRSAETELTRHLGLFNLSWSSGVPIGTVAAGYLFEIRPALPFYVSAFMVLVTLFVIAHVPKQSTLHRDERISTAPAESPERRRRSGKRYFLYLAWLSMLASFFTIWNVRYQLPKRAIDAGMGEGEIALFLFVMSIAQLLLFLVLARSDAWQFRFRYIFLAHFMSAMSMLLVFFSLSQLSLFIAMILFGVGNGIVYFSSLYYGMALQTVRGRNAAIHESTIGAGFLLGAFGGGLLAEHWNLAMPYLFCLGLISLAAVAWLPAAWRERSAIH
ncbi:MAG: MFS transporter [bacterium]